MLCARGTGTVKVLTSAWSGLGERDSGDGHGHVVGTPLYMAPESARGAEYVSAPSDVYAVGAVAYALVTGQQVFTGNSGVEIIGHHMHSAPVPPSERLGRPLDPFLERLILDCLAKRPADRPADAGAVLEAIESGWKGPAWTQREARLWWATKAPPMLQARRALEAILRPAKRSDGLRSPRRRP
jgi:serine/threonine-protein kinase